MLSTNHHAALPRSFARWSRGSSNPLRREIRDLWHPAGVDTKPDAYSFPALLPITRYARDELFETATPDLGVRRKLPSGGVGRYGPWVIVSMLIVVLLVGGALYTARLSEGRPRVVYTASLEQVEDESQDPLRVNIKTADVEELDELPEVGPSTAQSIIDYRQNNGKFRSVDELAAVRKCKTREVRFRALLAQDGGSAARNGACL
jgi:competence ComEA-like helix-hairpin-helix protein